MKEQAVSVVGGGRGRAGCGDGLAAAEVVDYNRVFVLVISVGTDLFGFVVVRFLDQREPNPWNYPS